MRHRETGGSTFIMGATITKNPPLQTGLPQKPVGEDKVRNNTAHNKIKPAVAVWRGLRGNSLHEGRPAEQSHDEMPIKKLIAHKTVYTGLRSGFG
jgi:hypothetical protein